MERSRATRLSRYLQGPNRRPGSGSNSDRSGRSPVLSDERSNPRKNVRAEILQGLESSLQPRGIVEATLVEALAHQVARLRLGSAAGPGRKPLLAGRSTRQIYDLAASLASLRDLTNRRKFGRSTPASAMPAPELPASPVLAAADVTRGNDVPDDTDPPSDSALIPADSACAADLWRDRLVLDPEISSTSPVVRDTRMTVRHVVSLVVDGWSWAAIRNHHPELDDDAIRACLAYCVEEEGGGVSYD